MFLSLSSIQLDRSFYPRQSEPTAEEVETYAASFEHLPPVEVWVIDGREGYWLIDGRCRMLAAEKLGLDEVEAHVQAGTEQAALERAFDANLANGRPLTAAERTAAAKVKLALHPDWTDARLSAACGVSRRTIVALRSSATSTTVESEQNAHILQLCKKKPLPSGGQRVGPTGRTYTVRPRVQPTKPQPLGVLQAARAMRARIERAIEMLASCVRLAEEHEPLAERCRESLNSALSSLERALEELSP